MVLKKDFIEDTERIVGVCDRLRDVCYDIRDLSMQFNRGEMPSLLPMWDQLKEYEFLTRVAEQSQSQTAACGATVSSLRF